LALHSCRLRRHQTPKFASLIPSLLLHRQVLTPLPRATKSQSLTLNTQADKALVPGLLVHLRLVLTSRHCRASERRRSRCCDADLDSQAQSALPKRFTTSRSLFVGLSKDTTAPLPQALIVHQMHEQTPPSFLRPFRAGFTQRLRHTEITPEGSYPCLRSRLDPDATLVR
jgi:hypothetical protein